MNNFFYHQLSRLKARGIFPKGFLDIGAHFGETNEIIRHVYPGTRIVSFEANPNCEEILKSKGIEYVIGILGDVTTEKVSFYVNSNNPTCTGCSIHKERSHHYDNAQVVELPMYRLDEVITDTNTFDFLKMDVQGAELNVLDGATNMLPGIKWIYLEVSFVQLNDNSPLFGEVFDYLRKKGYEIMDLCDPTWTENHRLIQCNFLFEKR